MVRGALSKVAWVGRVAVFLVGLAVILALVFGVATSAMGANGDFFKLGRANIASAVSTLTKSGAGPALSLKVDSGPPLAVNSSKTVAKLSADKLDGKEPRQLPGAIATTKRFAGDLTPGIQQEIFHSPNWGFDGPTVRVSTTSNQRLLGGANAVLGVTFDPGVSFKYGLCYRRATNPPNPVVNFLGNDPATDVHSYGFATTDLSTFAHTATVTPGAGTWDVGFCTTADDLDGPDRNAGVSGWVQVVNQ